MNILALDLSTKRSGWAVKCGQNEVEYVQKSAEKLDFSKISYQGIPSKLYKIVGKIKI